MTNDIEQFFMYLFAILISSLVKHCSYLLLIFFFLMYLFVAALGLCCCSRAFSSCCKGATLHCGARVPHCSGFSGFQARVLRTWTFVVVAHGLNCPVVCGILSKEG